MLDGCGLTAAQAVKKSRSILVCTDFSLTAAQAVKKFLKIQSKRSGWLTAAQAVKKLSMPFIVKFC